MTIKFRKKIFERIAQTAPLPTAQVAQTQSVSGSPPSFVVSNYYPSVILAFGNKNIPWINQLGNIINTSLFYTSNGQISLVTLKNVNFNFESDQAPSVDLKNLINFTKLMYNTIFTNLGQSYTQALNQQQIKDKVTKLFQSQPLNNLSSVNPIGQLATKINGNLKESIKNLLLQIQ